MKTDPRQLQPASPKSSDRVYAHSAEAVVNVRATAEALFAYLDDQASLGSHMEKPSAMMMGGRMTYAFDEAQGRAIGSVIRMGGSVLGLRLSVEEVIVERAPPFRKAWETQGRTHLMIIGAYRMGFEIGPTAESRRLRVFIAYNHPRSVAGRILAGLFASIYARWCVRRMANDALRYFLAHG